MEVTPARVGSHPHPLLRTWLFGPDADSAAHEAMTALIPSEGERAGARRMVEAFESARARGEGRALVDGLWAEVPTYLNAKRLLAQPRGVVE